MFPDAPFNSNPFRKQAVAPTQLDAQANGAAWFGATVAPLAADGEVKKGMPAKATVIVFRNQTPDTKQIGLTRVSPGIYRLADGTAIQREADRKRFLPGCAWVAVVRNDKVRWLHVGNSWSTYTKPGQTQALKQIAQCYVSFSDADAAQEFTQGNTLTVHAFSGVLKLEEHVVSLE
jgi:hypothetical protein